MRVVVVGTSGAGKTTFARRLAARLAATHVELDAINWGPGWRDLNTHDPVEFRRRVGEAAAGDAWVSDGNYGKVSDLLLARATDIVWLDYSRAVIMRRVFWRSFTRAITGAELWPGSGNRESFHRWLDREHPVRWAWDTHAERRRRYDALLAHPSSPHIRKHRVDRASEGDRLIDRLAACSRAEV